jgi:hypothetical protein
VADGHNWAPATVLTPVPLLAPDLKPFHRNHSSLSTHSPIIGEIIEFFSDLCRREWLRQKPRCNRQQIRSDHYEYQSRFFIELFPASGVEVQRSKGAS